jgi:hypothetical protein
MEVQEESAVIDPLSPHPSQPTYQWWVMVTQIYINIKSLVHNLYSTLVLYCLCIAHKLFLQCSCKIIDSKTVCLIAK